MIAFTAIPVSPARAYDSDAALEQYGVLCTSQITRQERRYGIPSRLLGAVAATETGRYHKRLKIMVPWPWSINVEGQGYMYHTKQEAVAAVQKFQARGKRSIDVGCMQVNLMHHPDAFANLNQAFDPGFNVDYAARFLRGNFDESHSWKTAVGWYHSHTPSYAIPYTNTVYSRWYGITTGKDARNYAAKAERPRKQYATFVRMGNQQIDFTKDPRAGLLKTVGKSKGTMPNEVSADRRVIKIASAADTKGRYDLAVIRPTQASGKVAQASEAKEAVATGPVVINLNNDVEGFSSPEVISNKSSDTVDDSRFIQFTN